MTHPTRFQHPPSLKDAVARIDDGEMTRMCLAVNQVFGQGMAGRLMDLIVAARRDACSRDRAAVERPEPEPGGHWATRDNEPDSRTDPEGHRDWQRDRDAQREEGTW